MKARVAIPLIAVVAIIALIIGAVTGVVAVVVFAAVGLVAAIVGGIWAGRKVTPSSGPSDEQAASADRPPPPAP